MYNTLTKVTHPNQSLFSNDPVENLDLDNPFFDSHLITYIGNKRRLAPFLYNAFLSVRKRLGKDRLVVLDGFVGSGAAARVLKAFASELHVNDLEDYAETINSTYLADYDTFEMRELERWIQFLNANKNSKRNSVGFIESHYAPKDDDFIRDGERVFYTNSNARIIDTVRDLITTDVPANLKIPCLASLLVRASIHTNTSGVFKGFHKKNGIGHFGGKGENALSRIKSEIVLEMPIFSDFKSRLRVHKQDTNMLVRDKSLPEFDLVYYDPPYNQHPYGSNYFMLNIINNGVPIEIQDGVSGIAKSWNKSDYNKRNLAEDAMDTLIRDTNSRFIVISYNNEGIIPIDTFKSILSRYGKWNLFEQNYNTYRGSRNLKERNLMVQEHLWILEKN
jgi:adenine-specific DNA-methyltransferase